MILQSHFPCNIPICHKCARVDGVVSKTCPHDPQGLSLVHHAETDDCPLGKFPPPTNDCITVQDRQYVESHFRKLWRRFHRRPVEYSDPASELIELQKLIAEVPCGQCRNGAVEYVRDNPPDFSSPRAYHIWLTNWHSSVSVTKVNKPPMTAPHAARVHGLTSLCTPDELAGDAEPVRITLRCDWSIGDEIIATAAVRDLLATYPNEYAVTVEGHAPEVWENLPVSFVQLPSRLGRAADPGVMPTPHDLIHIFNVNYSPHRHFIEHARQQLEETIGRRINQGPMRGWIVLTEEELSAPPPTKGNYIVAAFGGKVDATTKLLPPETWQSVIDHFDGAVKFVAVGGSGDEHIQPEMRGVVDMVGRTTLRQLFAMIAHENCQMVCSGITSLLHIAQSLGKPTVTVAAARENNWTARYFDRAEWIQTHVPCAGCFKLRVRAHRQQS